MLKSRLDPDVMSGAYTPTEGTIEWDYYQWSRVVSNGGFVYDGFAFEDPNTFVVLTRDTSALKHLRQAPSKYTGSTGTQYRVVYRKKR